MFPCYCEFQLDVRGVTVSPLPRPTLEVVSNHGARVWTDSRLTQETGVVIGFTERGGGVSEPPFTGLNLAAHVGDAPESVDANRSRLLSALGMSHLRDKLTVPDQVHGSEIGVVNDAMVGSGAFAAAGRAPVPDTDALVTTLPAVPLMLCFADCVPVILVAPGPTVAVVHAGWRGALALLPGLTAEAVASLARCEASELRAYIGPHIRACHYEVDVKTMSHFVNTCGTLSQADSGGLNLEAAVTASLTDAGLATCSISRLGTCTAEATDRFFSYRAEQGLTGRHAALACILPRV